MPDYGLYDNNEVINAVRRRKITNFYVEFLQQGGPKPHVIIRLKIRSVVVGGVTYLGCRLAMNSVGSTNGEFNITPIIYGDTSRAAHAAFEFRVKRTDWTVGHVLAALVPEGLGNLSEFSFADGFQVPGDRTEYIDGCRDFM